MKKLISILALVAIAFTVSAQGILFEENQDLNVALSKAKAEDKLVFIDAYADWCGPCKMMASNIFPLKEVGDFFNANFINLKLDMEKGPNVEISKKYAVTAYPTYLFLDGDGEVVHRGIGSMPADKFIEVGKTAVDSENNFQAISRKVKNGDRSRATIKKYLSSNPSDPGNESLVEECLHRLSEDEIFTKDTWELFQYIQDYNSPSFQFFLENREKVAELVGKLAVDNKIASTIFQNMRRSPEKEAEIRAIDPEIFDKIAMQIKFSVAFTQLQENPTDASAVKKFIEAGNNFLANEDNPEKINSFAWMCYEFYKQNESKELAANALVWAKKAHELAPGNDQIMDTYANLLFVNGKKKEAIKMETKALEIAKAANDKERIELYTKTLEEFKVKKKK